MKNHQTQKVKEVVDRHRTRKSDEVHQWCGHQFRVLPNVFSPFLSPSGQATRALMGTLNFSGKRVWEVGCGAGIFSCVAALGGAKYVLASDSEAEAVRNTELNRDAHNLSNKIICRHGDLFEALKNDQQFEIIYADLPWAPGQPGDGLDRAFFSPSLDVLHRFTSKVSDALAPHGILYLCLSDLEGTDPFIRQLKAKGLSPRKWITIDFESWVSLNIFSFSRQ